MQDNSIIELFFARSEQGITELQKKYGKLCAQIAYNILSNSEDADEAVNIAYERIWNAIPPTKPESLCGYLCTTVRNSALNLFDKLKRRSCDEFYDELGEIIPDRATVESNYDSRQISVYINEFLAKSPKKSRQIFVARYYYNMSIEAISNAVGMNRSTVKSRLSRTRSGLKKYLTERGVDI